LETGLQGALVSASIRAMTMNAVQQGLHSRGRVKLTGSRTTLRKSGPNCQSYTFSPGFLTS
jgi:hypothetical protein